MSTIEQLDFPQPALDQLDFPQQESVQRVFPGPVTPPVEPQTDQLPTHSRALTEASATLQLEGQSSLKPQPQRKPVIIRGNGTKRLPTARPTTRRRLLVQLAAASLLTLVLLTTALAVTPINSEGQTALSIIPPLLNFKNVNSPNTIPLAQQQATATAILSKQGYDPSGSSGGPSVPTSGTGNRFYYGQCTFWAAERYHQLTGIWVPWLGNAYQWAAGARASGWTVSSVPKKGSILVLQPGVQGASYGYGHVAVVESINADGSVYVSQWNWGGAYATTTYWTFQTGAGVSFVWESHLA
jgi:surface antigen